MRRSRSSCREWRLTKREKHVQYTQLNYTILHCYVRYYNGDVMQWHANNTDHGNK